VGTLGRKRCYSLALEISSRSKETPVPEGLDAYCALPNDIAKNPSPEMESGAYQSFVKPSVLHCSEPTPLWTKNSPSGSYFCFIWARRG
jgi:hypothetical protein